jgi:UDP-3-O-[3-hydroxymyristoyl] glucosamine N-acyltransferase
MTFKHPIRITEIAQLIGAELIAENEQSLTWLAIGLNEIHKVRPGDITFVDVAKYFEKSLKSAATFVILNEKTSCPVGKILLLHSNPFKAYDNLMRLYCPFEPLTQHISPKAQIHETAIIEAGVVIGHDVEIGENCYIQANAIIHGRTIIGKNVNIGAGCIIGTDAFYFKKQKLGEVTTEFFYEKWQSGGRVIIEDNADIGAGCTLNLGVSGDTIIGEGSKLDCQCHIGHGVVVGKNCLFAAQVGIGGKTIIEDNVILYGQVGVGQALHIGAGAVVLGKSGVTKSLEGAKTYFGYPAQETRIAYRELATLRSFSNKKK